MLDADLLECRLHEGRQLVPSMDGSWHTTQSMAQEVLSMYLGMAITSTPLGFLRKFHTAYYEITIIKRDLLDEGLETISYNERKGQAWCCGLNCVPSNSYDEALTPSTSECH